MSSGVTPVPPVVTTASTVSCATSRVDGLVCDESIDRLAYLFAVVVDELARHRLVTRRVERVDDPVARGVGLECA